MVEGAPQPKAGVRMKSYTLGVMRNLLTRTEEKIREVWPQDPFPASISTFPKARDARQRPNF